MPRIEEYTPQIEAQGPLGAVSPNLEEVTATGRGIERFGSNVNTGIDEVLNRQRQAEESDAAATFAGMRADYLDQINQQTSDGTIDSQKVMNQYDQDVSNQQDRFNSPGGRDTFNRYAARVRGSLLVKASRAQASVASKNAQGDFQNTVNINSGVLEQNPDQFQDIHDGMVDQIQTLVSNGSISAQQAPKVQATIGKQLSQSAIRGYMKADFNDATSQVQNILDNSPNNIVPPKAEALAADMSSFNRAKQAMDTGKFDSYLDSTDKKQLEAEMRQHQAAAITETNRLITIKRAALQAQNEQFMNQNINGMISGQTPMKAILNAPIDWKTKLEAQRILEASSKETATDPAIKNNIIQRMLLPDNDPNKISEPGEVVKYVGNGISPQVYDQLTTWFDKTPQGQILNERRKDLIGIAKSQIVSDSLMGGKDPDGESSQSAFVQALQNKEQEYRSQGKSVASLYDINDKQNYFGNQIAAYVKTTQQKFKSFADRMNGIPSPQQIQQNPGVQPTLNITQPQNDMVPGIDPSGKQVFIPRANLEKAKQRGYKVQGEEQNTSRNAQSTFGENDLNKIRSELDEQVRNIPPNEGKTIASSQAQVSGQLINPKENITNEEISNEKRSYEAAGFPVPSEDKIISNLVKKKYPQAPSEGFLQKALDKARASGASEEQLTKLRKEYENKSY